MKTGLQIEIPYGCYGRIAARSGIGYDKNIMVNAGVVDGDYRGEIVVYIFNLSCTQRLDIKRGDPIAQIIFERYIHIDEVVKSNTPLEELFGATERSIAPPSAIEPDIADTTTTTIETDIADTTTTTIETDITATTVV